MNHQPNRESSVSIVNDSDIGQLLGMDELFVSIFNQYGPPPAWSRPQGFISLSKIILEQQVSLASANSHFNRLNNYLTEFTPVRMVELTDEEMRNCQISRQKSVYLRALSRALINDDINPDEWPILDQHEVRRQLTGIKGIGDWTADVYLMFCLQAKDIFPIGDIALRNTICELSDAKTSEEMTALAEKWKPFRSLATYFLWHHYLKKRNRS